MRARWNRVDMYCAALAVRPSSTPVINWGTAMAVSVTPTPITNSSSMAV
jgi:hypothetical protein